MKSMIWMLVVGLQALLAGSAFATPQDKKVVLSINRSWAPYLLINKETGLHGGLVLDALAEVSAQTGYQIDVELLPSKRSRIYLEQGKIDAKLKAREWVKDADHYYWTSPIVAVRDVVIFRKATPVTYQRPQDLRGKVIGARIGWGYPKLESLFQSGSAVREDAATDKAMLSMLLLGRTDAATMNVHVLKWYQSTNDRYRDEIAFAEPAIEDVGLRMYLSKQNDWRPFVKAFDAEISAMRKDGRLRAIIERYISM